MIVPTNSQNIIGGGIHNYSTEEQVVGTWIDGKPLYEKTYFIENANNTESLMPLGLNLDTVISIQGSFYREYSGSNFTSWYEFQGSYTGASGWCNVSPSNDELYYRVSTDLGTIIKKIITIQYTKTTD